LRIAGYPFPPLPISSPSQREGEDLRGRTSSPSKRGEAPLLPLEEGEEGSPLFFL